MVCVYVHQEGANMSKRKMCKARMKVSNMALAKTNKKNEGITALETEVWWPVCLFSKDRMYDVKEK